MTIEQSKARIKASLARIEAAKAKMQSQRIEMDRMARIMEQEKEYSIEDFWSGSACQSIQNDYESGNFRTIKL